MKPHVRLVRLKDCPQGARAYWVGRDGLAHRITVIWQDPLKQQTGLHFGHEFNMRAKRHRFSRFTPVYLRTN